MSDRSAFLRRAGAGAAGLSLAQLLGPAAALAGGGGGDYPAHPRWRFMLVSHQTLDPLFVATQFGAQDAAALVDCSVEWMGSPHGSVKETVAALKSAISRKADGIAVSIVDPRAFSTQVEAARTAGIPLLALNVDLSTNARIAFVGENPYTAGARVAAEITRLVPGGAAVALLAPAGAPAWAERRLEGITAALDRAKRAPAWSVVRLSGSQKAQEAAIEALLGRRPALRGLFATSGVASAAAGRVLEGLGSSARGVRAGGFDLLPDDLTLVADGHLDFVVDQQPYVQGLDCVLQLFLARISQGVVFPWDAETSVMLRKPDVERFLATKSRFEGSSSRHEYPLRRT